MRAALHSYSLRKQLVHTSALNDVRCTGYSWVSAYYTACPNCNLLFSLSLGVTHQYSRAYRIIWRFCLILQCHTLSWVIASRIIVLVSGHCIVCSPISFITSSALSKFHISSSRYAQWCSIVLHLVFECLLYYLAATYPSCHLLCWLLSVFALPSHTYARHSFGPQDNCEMCRPLRGFFIAKSVRQSQNRLKGLFLVPLVCCS